MHLYFYLPTDPGKRSKLLDYLRSVAKTVEFHGENHGMADMMSTVTPHCMSHPSGSHVHTFEGLRVSVVWHPAEKYQEIDGLLVFTEDLEEELKTLPVPDWIVKAQKKVDVDLDVAFGLAQTSETEFRKYLQPILSSFYRDL